MRRVTVKRGLGFLVIFVLLAAGWVVAQQAPQAAAGGAAAAGAAAPRAAQRAAVAPTSGTVDMGTAAPTTQFAKLAFTKDGFTLDDGGSATVRM